PTYPSPVTATMSTKPSPSMSPMAFENPSKPTELGLALSSDQTSAPVAPSSSRSTPVWQAVGVVLVHWQQAPLPVWTSMPLPETKTMLGESSGSTLPSQLLSWMRPMV